MPIRWAAVAIMTGIIMVFMIKSEGGSWRNALLENVEEKTLVVAEAVDVQRKPTTTPLIPMERIDTTTTVSKKVVKAFVSDSTSYTKSSISGSTTSKTSTSSTSTTDIRRDGTFEAATSRCREADTDMVAINMIKLDDAKVETVKTNKISKEAKPFCQCAHGSVARGHGRIVGFEHYKGSKYEPLTGWSMYPAECDDCECVEVKALEPLQENSSVEKVQARLRLMEEFAREKNVLAAPAKNSIEWKDHKCSRLEIGDADLLTFKTGCNGLDFGNAASLVWIAGRAAKTADEGVIMGELQTSIFSACAKTTSQLHLHVMLSEPDFGAPDTYCISCWLASTCHAALRVNPSFQNDSTSLTRVPVVFTEIPLRPVIKNWFRESGIVSFSHRSTWFGYSKIWLPDLLPNIDVAAFVDTDTYFTKDPTILLQLAGNFDHFQAISGLHLENRLYRYRFNSGCMLMSMKRLRETGWRSEVNHFINKNRGMKANESTEGYTENGKCVRFKFGAVDFPMCLTMPCRWIDGHPPKDSGWHKKILCDNPNQTWFADAGDQEFLSYFVSRKPEWFSKLPDGIHKHIQHWKLSEAPLSTLVVLHSPEMARHALAGVGESQNVNPVFRDLFGFPKDAPGDAKRNYGSICQRCQSEK